jgi:hypothetical protein
LLAFAWLMCITCRPLCSVEEVGVPQTAGQNRPQTGRLAAAAGRAVAGVAATTIERRLADDAAPLHHDRLPASGLDKGLSKPDEGLAMGLGADDSLLLMRRPLMPATVRLALVAVAAPVAGCGENSSASPLPTHGPVTKAEATAYANAVNLGPTDVPEMVGIGVEGEHKEVSPLIETCGIRERHADDVADVKSPTFRSGGNGGGVPLQEVKSDVEVMSTAALADRKLAHTQAAIHSPRIRACLARVYAQIFAKPFAKGNRPLSLGRTTVSALHPALPRSFGMRVVVPFALTVNGLKVDTRLYVDALAFIVGRAAVSLVTLRFTYPVPAATEQRLLSLLYGRAKA